MAEATESTAQTDSTPTAATGTDPAGTPQVAAPEPTGQPAERTVPQSEVNKLVGQTRSQARERLLKDLGFDSEDAVKAALGRLKTIEDAQKTAEERLQAEIAQRDKALADAQAENARLAQQRTETLIRAEVIAKAQAAGWRDPNDAYRMVDLSTVKVQEDGSVAGVAEQLAALTTAKPYLLTPTGTLGPTNPGRPGTSAVETDDQRRTRLWGAGDTPIGRGQGGGVFAPE